MQVSGQTHDLACLIDVDSEFISVLFEEVEELGPFYQSNVLVFGKLMRIRTEMARRHENSAVSLLCLDGTEEVAHCGNVEVARYTALDGVEGVSACWRTPMVNGGFTG